MSRYFPALRMWVNLNAPQVISMLVAVLQSSLDADMFFSFCFARYDLSTFQSHQVECLDCPWLLPLCDVSRGVSICHQQVWAFYNILSGHSLVFYHPPVAYHQFASSCFFRKRDLYYQCLEKSIFLSSWVQSSFQIGVLKIQISKWYVPCRFYCFQRVFSKSLHEGLGAAILLCRFHLYGSKLKA